MKLTSIISGALLTATAFAETHTLDWTASWAELNPDGVQSRQVITCNGEFPWPNLKVKKGDTVVIKLTNNLTDENTSLHFHGLFQHNTTHMDGPPMLNQCETPPGHSYTYNFSVPDQVGSYWYHSHSKGQYMDGMRGAFIIEDDDFPYDYDEEVVLTVSEWYHELIPELTSGFLNRYNPTGAEPIPQNLLFNDTMNGTWNVQPDTTYLLRIINIGGFVSQYLWMEGHEFTVIAVDGIYVEKNTTDLLYITVAQRYDVLVHTKNETDANYAFMQRFDIDMLDVIPDELQLNTTSHIVYDSDADLPGEYYIDDLDSFLDDFYLVPLEQEEILPEPDYTITIDVIMDNLGDGVNYAFFNNITFTTPKVPVLGTVFSAGEDATNPLVYGSNTNTFVLDKDDVVEIVLNNQDTGKHPFHLHGHVFQIIERAAGVDESLSPVPYNASIEYEAPEYPARRDVLYVRPQSYFRIRFKADNPGVWYFHCHIEWHLLQGLALVLVEDPASIQEFVNVGDEWYSNCDVAGIQTEGNAAGNTANYLNLDGENVQKDALASGFTARGIVALVFSCVAGVLGCIMIGVYGMADIPNIEQKVMQDLNIDQSRDLLADDELADEDDSATGSKNEAVAREQTSSGSSK